MKNADRQQLISKRLSDFRCYYYLEEMYKKHDHPLHKEYVELGEKDDHGGMDLLVCRAFIESVKKDTNTPIDAYNSILWAAIAPLSEASIAMGCTCSCA